MTTEQKAKAYDEALERARKELKQDLHESGVWAIQRIFPELRESEDERIRKELKEAFEAYDIESKWNGIPIRSIFAWLEKQKENPKNADSIPSDCTSDAKCEDRSQKHNISVDDIAQDYVDGVKEFNPEPTWDLMQTAVCYGYHYREQQEQKPADMKGLSSWLKSLERFGLQPKQEWSEVELEFRGEKVKVKRPFFRDDNGRGYSTTEQDDEVTWNALRAWAESHGYTPFELYPREEWSEEDEDVKRGIICALSGGLALTTKEQRSKMLDWLKSLRPQPQLEWSEEDEKIRNLAIEWAEAMSDQLNFVDMNPTDFRKIIAWLKALRPSWKPSKEQMEAFKGYIEDFQAKAEAAVGGWNNFDVMIRLYEQLKKL